MLIIIASLFLISILFAPLGCVLIWQKQSYFADGLAHACLLATSLAVALGFSPLITAPAVAIVFSVLILLFKGRLEGNIAINIVSGILLAAGILIASSFPGSVSLSNMLLGDILSVTYDNLIMLIGVCLTCGILLWYKLDSLILLSLNRDLAQLQGVRVQLVEMIFFILLAAVLSLGISIIGALLSSALLIIPAATAYYLGKTPTQMIMFSIVISITAALLGLGISFYSDTPTVPCIILISGILYFCARIQDLVRR